MANNEPLVGQQINNYRIVASVASGAFGVVYQAQHQYLQERIVAIKVLHMHLGGEEEQQSFLREAQILEKLQHQYILSILDFGIFQHLPYLITPYARLGSLRHHLDQTEQLLPWHITLRILTQIGQALHYAHQQRIIHRDLKPENILLAENNKALLADFGIASILAGQSMKYTQVVGTPSYMAPEQFRGIISPQSDQYALACIAYELVTGQTPFDAPDFIAMGFKHASETVPPPSHFALTLPKGIEQAILKALSKERSDRYPDVKAFLSALQTSPAPAILTSKREPAHQQSSQTGSTAEQLLDESSGLWKSGNNEEALVACREALRLDPNNEEALLEMGFIFKALHRDEEALISYHRVLHLNPNSIEALLGKGSLLAEADQYQEALTIFDQVLHLDQENSNALAWKCIMLSRVGKKEEALLSCEQSLRLAPDNMNVLSEKASILHYLERYRESLTTYEQIVSLDPENAPALAGKGLALYKLDRYEEALAFQEQALRLDPQDERLWFEKGKTLSAMEQYRSALSAYDQVLRLKPDLAAAYREKGYTLSRLDRYDEAIVAFNRSLRLYSHNPRTYTGKGWALAQLDQYPEALACYDNALRIAPNYKPARDLRQEALQRMQ